MANYVVIGGSSGIGKAVVDRLVENNDTIVATFCKNEISSENPHLEYFPLDVMHETLNVEALPEQIDGLVYCPGSIRLKPFTRFTETDFLDDFKLQVLGATNSIKALLPKMKKSNKASIVLYSTVAVQQGFNYHAQVSISKGAIEGLTRALAAEFAPKIRVNAIAPALTNTPLAERLLNTEEKMHYHASKNPLKRVGQAADIANATLFLLSEKSSWITGQILHVDGGFSALNV